jgi:hypothetical protein
VVARLVMCLERQEESFWWGPVRKRLLDPRYQNKGALVGILKQSSSLRAIELAKSALARRVPGENPDPYLYVLEHFAQRAGASPRLRSAAVEAIFTAVEADRAEEFGSAYFNLFHRDPRRTLPLAETYLFHVMKQPAIEQDFPASLVLREWARHRGRSAQRLLRSWTAHPQLGRPALEAMTELGIGSGDVALIESWLKLAGEKNDPRVYYQIAAIGGDKAKRAALELFQKSGASRSHEVGLWWRLNDISLEKALRASVQLGMLERMPSAEAVRKACRAFDPLDSPFPQWMSVMAREGRAAHFDTETSSFPNRHDQLIQDILKKGGGGKFLPGSAVEVWRSEGEYYDVAFEHRGKWYQFQAKGLGDWYDVSSTLQAVNRALADSGCVERFYPIVTGGQDAFLLFASPDGIKGAADALRLTVESDPDGARRLGKAFEEEMVRRLGVVVK